MINGPNLGILGKRQPEIYGNKTLRGLEKQLTAEAKKLAIQIEFFQSNHEGEIVDTINAALHSYDALIINPAAYTHTSVAIYDALASLAMPIFEVHLSNIYAREDFRHTSFVSKIAKGVICGFGTYSYTLALHAANNFLDTIQA